MVKVQGMRRAFHTGEGAVCSEHRHRRVAQIEAEYIHLGEAEPDSPDGVGEEVALPFLVGQVEQEAEEKS